MIEGKREVRIDTHSHRLSYVTKSKNGSLTLKEERVCQCDDETTREVFVMCEKRQSRKITKVLNCV